MSVPWVRTLSMRMQMPFPGQEEELKPGEYLKQYTRDLTEAARQGKLDPVIGRSDEIARAIQVLSRRTKNNPIFIGDPGVSNLVCCLANSLVGWKNRNCRRISATNRRRRSS